MMDVNNDFTDDAMWNALAKVIEAFLEGRIRSVNDNGSIDFGVVPTRTVEFDYHYSELYKPDNKVNTFVKNIMLTLRDKEGGRPYDV